MGQSSQKVKVDQLQPGMIIEEVTELSFDYASLDEETLKFMQSALKGASALVLGDNGIRAVPVAELKPFDQVQGITQIPASLKLAQVVPGHSALLEKHGLMEFKVTGSAKPTAPVKKQALAVGSDEAKKLHKVKREEVKKFVDTLETAAVNRDKSSGTVEDMLDQGRAGKFSSAGVETMVEEIIKQGSSPAMKAIAGLKGSDQTYAHCTDMSVILQESYIDILKRGGRAVSETNLRFALTAGFMHDIGKSEVPKDILESTQRFAPDSKEMLIMRNHTTYGARILGEMGMPEVSINVAHYHHVKKDTTLLNSYPAIEYDKVGPLTRLASITDVYQALIGRRRYKRNWVPAKAIEYLINLKGTEFDDRVLDQFIEAMGRYPVGSLVRLSTDELAFVLMLGPREFPDRPIVAVVENPNGELIAHHTLVDLMLDAELSVKEIVDHYEHFKESEDQAYRIFQSIRVS